MFGTLHPDEIEDILFSHHVGHLACVADGRPYVVPITYTYDGGALYGQTTRGRKVDAMRRQADVSFGIEEHGDPRRWRSVIVEGTYEELSDNLARQRAIDLLDTTFPTLPPGPDRIVFRIHVTGKTGRWVRFTE
jgi:nitroimidazol reductase NimA-like FMN-containing flavoprotein (pyridoxamine 5'-phosphate oxidase superfamily)